MPLCSKCGAQYDDSANFCPNCGTANPRTYRNQESGSQGRGAQNFFNSFFNTHDTTADYDKADIEKNQLMAILLYLGILVLIPILAAKDSKFARYHANQGLILLVAEAIWVAATRLISFIVGLLNIGLLSFLFGVVVCLLSLVPLVFVIFGIYNSAAGKARELPFIGKFRIIQ